MFSSGGLFNYSAFSLQITREHSGVQASKESGCGESDEGIRRIPMVNLEPELLSQFPRGRRCPLQRHPSSASAVGHEPRTSLLSPPHPPDSSERWERKENGERACGGGAG